METDGKDESSDECDDVTSDILPEIPGTPKTAEQVRYLSNSYQSLVSKATVEIERLLRERRRMEMKQGKILQENIQLTLKAKDLIAEKKFCNKEREVSKIDILLAIFLMMNFRNY